MSEVQVLGVFPGEKTVDLHNDRYQKKVRTIEGRSKEEIWAILEKAGIQRGSQDWRDYVRAKRLIFKRLWINSKIYDRQIRWICDFLNL